MLVNNNGELKVTSIGYHSAFRLVQNKQQEMMAFEESRQEIALLSRNATSAFKDGDFEQCVKLYHEAYIKSTNLEENVVKTCTLNYGAALVVLGKTKLSMEDKKDAGISDLKTAIEILHKITPVYESQTHIDINADVYFNIAYAYQLLKENEKAIEFYKQAEKEYMTDRKFDQQLKCLHLIIQLHQEEKRFDMAAKVYKDMSKVHKFNNKKLEQADCLCQSMLLLMKNKAGREKTDKVADKCMKCIEEIELTGKDCVEAAKICNEVGLVLVQLGNPAGEHSFKKALDLLNKSALPMSPTTLEAVFQQNLGAAYNISGKYQEAIEAHLKAVDKYGQLKNRSGQAQCYINCAYAYSKLDYPNNLENADRYFLHALQAAKDSNDNHMMWQTYEGLGAISFQRGRVEEAKEYFKKALFRVGNTAVDESVKTRILEKYDKMKEELNRTSQQKNQVYLSSQQTDQVRNSHPRTLLTSLEEQIIPRSATSLNAQPRNVKMSQEVSYMSQKFSGTPRDTVATTEQTVSKQVAKSLQPVTSPMRKIPWRKKGSFGNHPIQKVSRGLATPTGSIYGSLEIQSPRFHSRRSLGLEPVASEESEENSSGDEDANDSQGFESTEKGISSGGSSEEEEETSDEDEEEGEEEEQCRKGSHGGDRQDGVKLKGLSQEKIDAIFARKASPFSHKSAGQPSNELTKYEELLRQKESQEGQQSEDQTEDSEGSEGEEETGDSEGSEGEEGTEDSEDEEETEVKKPGAKRAAYLVAPPLPTSSPASTGRVVTADLATYIKPNYSESKLSSTNSPAMNGHHPEQGSNRDRKKVSDDSNSDDDNDDGSTYAQIGNVGTLRNEGNFESVPEKSHRKHGPHRSRSSNFFDSDDQSHTEEMEQGNKPDSSNQQPPLPGRGNQNPIIQTDSNSDTEISSKIDQMPRGQRDKILAQKHAELQNQGRAAQGEHQMANEKESKSCAIM